jgi:CubicO group peptidase (beta-lactamase class C family)
VRAQRLIPVVLRWGLAVGTAAVAAFAARAASPAGDGARIARVENGLLPAFVVRGEPSAPMRLVDRMQAHHTPGVSVAVIDHGEIAWSRGYGVLQAGSDAAVTGLVLREGDDPNGSFAAKIE